MRFTGIRRPAALALTAFALAACEDEVTAPTEQLVEGTVVLDASSATEFAYISLETGAVVNVSDPYASDDWDIAFRRYSAKLNGGVAGNAGVGAYAIGNNADATAEQVLAFTAADAEADFAAVDASAIAGATFVQDGLIPDAGGSWFRFSPQAGTLVANPGAAWQVRESDGGYALFRVSELNMQGNIPLGLTVEYRHQSAGGSLGTPSTVSVDFSQGPGYIDFSTGSTVAADGCNWDLAFTPQFAVELNADCSAGTFPLDPTVDFTALTGADDAPEYGGFLSTISGAIPNSIGDASGLFWYGLQGNNRMWPTYNVFLVQRGTAVYKIQVTDYYDANSGGAGFPTLRYEQLR